MKKITEYFKAEELLSINALAQYLKDKYFKENERHLNSSLPTCFLLLISCASLRNI